MHHYYNIMCPQYIQVTLPMPWNMEVQNQPSLFQGNDKVGFSNNHGGVIHTSYTSYTILQFHTDLKYPATSTIKSFRDAP